MTPLRLAVPCIFLALTHCSAPRSTGLVTTVPPLVRAAPQASSRVFPTFRTLAPRLVQSAGSDTGDDTPILRWIAGALRIEVRGAHVTVAKDVLPDRLVFAAPVGNRWRFILPRGVYESEGFLDTPKKVDGVGIDDGTPGWGVGHPVGVRDDHTAVGFNPPPGKILLDAAFSNDTDGIALVEPGFAFVTHDGGQRWIPVTQGQATQGLRVLAREHSLRIVTDSGEVSITDNGTVEEAGDIDSVNPPEARDEQIVKQWLESSPFLPRRYESVPGYPISGTHRVVTVNRGGSMEVDLDTGTLLSETARTFPCESWTPVASDKALVVCRNGHVDALLRYDPDFHVWNAMASMRPCGPSPDGEPPPLAMCVSDSDGNRIVCGAVVADGGRCESFSDLVLLEGNTMRTVHQSQVKFEDGKPFGFATTAPPIDPNASYDATVVKPLGLVHGKAALVVYPGEGGIQNYHVLIEGENPYPISEAALRTSAEAPDDAEISAPMLVGDTFRWLVRVNEHQRMITRTTTGTFTVADFDGSVLYNRLILDYTTPADAGALWPVGGSWTQRRPYTLSTDLVSVDTNSPVVQALLDESAKLNSDCLASETTSGLCDAPEQPRTVRVGWGPVKAGQFEFLTAPVLETDDLVPLWNNEALPVIECATGASTTGIWTADEDAPAVSAGGRVYVSRDDPEAPGVTHLQYFQRLRNAVERPTVRSVKFRAEDVHARDYWVVFDGVWPSLRGLRCTAADGGHEPVRCSVWELNQDSLRWLSSFTSRGDATQALEYGIGGVFGDDWGFPRSLFADTPRQQAMLTQSEPGSHPTSPFTPGSFVWLSNNAPAVTMTVALASPADETGVFVLDGSAGIARRLHDGTVSLETLSAVVPRRMMQFSHAPCRPGSRGQVTFSARVSVDGNDEPIAMRYAFQGNGLCLVGAESQEGGRFNYDRRAYSLVATPRGLVGFRRNADDAEALSCHIR